MQLDGDELRAMAEEVEQAGGVLRPSRFWEGFAGRNTATLQTSGIDAFKRSVNFNYFQWVINSPRQPEFRSVLRRWIRRPSLTPVGARVCAEGVDWSRPKSAKQLPVRFRPHGHAVYVAMLWDVATRATGRVAARLEEPLLGDPIAVRVGGQRVSEDLANSLLEYGTIAAHVPPSRLASATLLEVGAGYGRFVDLFLTAHPDARAVVVDIPPALALSQAYLTARHPARRTHRFRRGLAPHELHDALGDAQLAFLTPNQLADLDPLGADVGVNVSSLHEMRPEQVEAYLRLFDRHVTGGFFYTKQWSHWFNPVDQVQTDRATYPYPAHWTKLVERTPVGQPAFFEALFAL